MSLTRQFRAPTVIITGLGAAKEAGAYAKQHGKKALIVTDVNLETHVALRNRVLAKLIKP